MATAYITEYSRIGKQSEGHGLAVPVASEPAIVDRTVTFSTATQSAVFNPSTRFIRLIADANCHVQFGTDPTATAAMQFIPANTEIWRMVEPNNKVSVYDGSS